MADSQIKHFCQGLWKTRPNTIIGAYLTDSQFDDCDTTKLYQIGLWGTSGGTYLAAGVTRVGVLHLFNKIDSALNREPTDIESIKLYVHYEGKYNITRFPTGGEVGIDFVIQDEAAYLGSSSAQYGVNKATNIQIFVHEHKESGVSESTTIDILQEYSWEQAELVSAGLTKAIMSDEDFGVLLQLSTTNPSGQDTRIDAVWNIDMAKVTDMWLDVTFTDGTNTIVPKRTFEITYMCGDKVNFEFDDIRKNDDAQVGDSKRIEDAIRFICQANGFQEIDPSKPFYYSIEESPVVINVPPLRYRIENNTKWAEALSDTMQSALPNYFMINTRDGKLVYKEINLQNPEKYEINHTIDVSENNTDTGVFTRVVAVGEGGESINVALHKGSGGNASIRAYKLNNFASATNGGAVDNGDTKTQTEANAVLSGIIDTNLKTPISPNNKFDWGLIYERRGDTTRRWTFEDEDLFVVDIGLNDYVKPTNMYDLSAIQVTVFNTFREGSIVSQSLAIYGMTQEDYEKEYGVSPPDNPDQDSADLDDASTYMPKSTARSWKLMTEEFNTDEGQTSIESNDFILGREVKVRFIKVRCTQAQYRFPDKSKGLKGNAKINISDLKLWTSRQVLAVSELGYTAPYDDDQHKLLADRLRRRTVVLDYSPYVDSYTRGKLHAQREMIERSTDFTPVAGNIVFPLLNVGDIIKVDHTNVPKMFRDVDGNLKKFFARAISQSSDGTIRVTLANFDIEAI